jgi:hypothetical protein
MTVANAETDSKTLLPHHHHTRHRQGWHPFLPFKSKKFPDVVINDTQESSFSAEDQNATPRSRWRVLFCWKKPMIKYVPSMDSSLSSFPVIQGKRFPPLPSVEYGTSLKSESTSPSKTPFPAQSKDKVLQFSPDEKSRGHQLQHLHDWSPATSPKRYSGLAQPREDVSHLLQPSPGAIQPFLPKGKDREFPSQSSRDAPGRKSPPEGRDWEFAVRKSSLRPSSQPRAYYPEFTQTPKTGDHHVPALQVLPFWSPIKVSTAQGAPPKCIKVVSAIERQQPQPVLNVSPVDQKGKNYWSPELDRDWSPERPRPLSPERSPRDPPESPAKRPLLEDWSPNMDWATSAQTALTTLSKTNTDWMTPSNPWFDDIPSQDPSQDSWAPQVIRKACSNCHVEIDPRELDPNQHDHTKGIEEIDPYRGLSIVPSRKIRAKPAKKTITGGRTERAGRLFSACTRPVVSPEDISLEGSLEGLVSLDSLVASYWGPEKRGTGPATPLTSNRYAEHLDFLQTRVTDKEK